MARFLVVNPDGIVENAIEASSTQDVLSLFPGRVLIESSSGGPGWRLSEGDFSPPEVEPVSMWEEMPTHEFLALFTPAEWSAFAVARATDPYIGQLMHILDRAQAIHRDHRLLRSGMQYAVSIGLLTPERLVALIGEA